MSNSKNILIFILIVISLCKVENSDAQSYYPDSINKTRLYTVAGLETGAYLAGLSYLRFLWYSDIERVPFHTYDDSRGYFQMDKFAHAYVAYYQTLISFNSLRWAGLNNKQALWFGGPAGTLFQTPIEIFDGLYEGWGFSWGDIAANSVGSALFITQQAIFEEQIVTMKFSYSPSGYPKYHSSLGETQLESFFLDYNAHSYWLSGNLNRLTGMNAIPKWLNIAIGYSANGMIKQYENPKYYNGEPFPEIPRYRQYILSLDVDFTRIETDKAWLRSLFRALNMIKVPFPAMEYNRIDGFVFRPIYF